MSVNNQATLTSWTPASTPVPVESSSRRTSFDIRQEPRRPSTEVSRPSVAAVKPPKPPVQTQIIAPSPSMRTGTLIDAHVPVSVPSASVSMLSPPMSPAGHAPSTKMYKSWVKKATTDATASPKPKYVRKMIVETWETHSTPNKLVVDLVERASSDANERIRFNTLVVIWKLMREGHHSVLQAFLELNDVLCSWSQTSLAHISAVLTKRLSLYKSFPDFEGNFSLETYILSTCVDG